MKTVDFAIERGFRLFRNEIATFHFFMIQIQINKLLVPDSNYIFNLFNNDKLIYNREIIIDSKNTRILTPNSHEDPLVQNNDNYMICFQLWDGDISQFECENVFFNLINHEKVVIFPLTHIGNLAQIFKYHFKKYSFLTENYEIYSDKDCVFRIHLGDENGLYSEVESFLKKGQLFNFKSYLNNPYVGLQCSYENDVPEIEEKHIVIGQKSMVLSGEYRENNVSYKALLPFDSKYQILYSPDEILVSNFTLIKKEKWTEINSIESLLNYYKDKEIKFFESNINFLSHQYKSFSTYGLNKIFTPINKVQKLKKYHIDLDICKTCPLNAKCVQIVPSELSPLVFKKNLLIENNEECEIFNLIERKI